MNGPRLEERRADPDPGPDQGDDGRGVGAAALFQASARSATIACAIRSQPRFSWAWRITAPRWVGAVSPASSSRSVAFWMRRASSPATPVSKPRETSAKPSGSPAPDSDPKGAEGAVEGEKGGNDPVKSRLVSSRLGQSGAESRLQPGSILYADINHAFEGELFSTGLTGWTG